MRGFNGYFSSQIHVNFDLQLLISTEEFSYMRNKSEISVRRRTTALLPQFD